MTGSEEAALSRRERQIMHVLYERGAATVGEVRDALSDAPSYSAVRTLIGILEAKGHVTHSRQGKRYVFAPARPAASAAKSALQQVIRTFFAGSVERVVETLLSDRETRLSEEEAQRLARMIAEASERRPDNE